MIDAVLLPPVVQGMRGNPAEGFAHGRTGDPARALLNLDSFLDELQGAGLELGTAPLWHDPIALEKVARNEPQGASVDDQRLQNTDG